MVNESAYPLKFALNALDSDTVTILEAGCGNGRILRRLRDDGYNVIGFDYVTEAMVRVKQVDGSLALLAADTRHLPFISETFDLVLAFGLFHSLEFGTNDALIECSRVLCEGGLLVASFREDNLHNRIVDWSRSEQVQEHQVLQFDKYNVTMREAKNLLRHAGFVVERQERATNMPLPFRSRIFRSERGKNFSESESRNFGYELNTIGKTVNWVLTHLFPTLAFSTLVFTCRKTGGVGKLFPSSN